MAQFNFNKWNTILGWLVFLIALITYALTVEPTVSYWDAGEFILTSSKLQVGHPPGAPLFQMLGAFFSIFALEPQQIGLMLNLMSGVASAFTILFMFWTITLLLKKLVNNTTTITANTAIAILGSSLVGSLAFAFTDSFWFNAVETEVYAMATFIMALLFWLALRWEQEMDTPRGDRWLVLIAFVIGLSFGVHFMGLLTIPAIGLIYFFKKYKTITPKNFIIANVIAVAILLFIFKLLLPNALKLFSAFELFFVNSFGLPFNSGSIIAGILIIFVFYYILKFTRKKEYKLANTLTLCFLFVFIGFSSWLMIPIRANANVVVNENNPSSARELLAYYNLEQYPKTHLFYGPLFTDRYSGLDENNPYVDDKPKYEKDKTTGQYIVVNDYKNVKQNYNSEHAGLLPRMWSSEHATNYFMFTGFLDFKLKPEYQMENELRAVVKEFKEQISNYNVDYDDFSDFLSQFGSYLTIEKPSFGDNIAFMLEYQLGYMYWRYFMWNFVGRQDDIQGKYDNFHGNWLSGINAIDKIHLGISQENLPSDVLNNKARNTYYFLPLILGLIGLFFLVKTDKKLFWVLLVFFLFTGIAIQFYTNIRPFEPRERDYSVIGSFYVFAICIGFGVFGLYHFFKTYTKSKLLAPLITLVALLAVPGILIANNWDDHDRSDKKTAHANALNYLNSCEPNAILFSIGDNDTFPLWYAQEIEGIRRDVRVINTSLFQTDWYIDQMKRKAYESDPIPSQLTHNQYKYGTRDYIIKQLISRDTLDIKDFMNFVSSDSPNRKYKYVLEKMEEDLSQYPRHMLNLNFMPVENIRIPVDKSAVLKHGIVKEKDADSIVPHIDLKIKGGALYKNSLLMLDILANNNWERPIYFSAGSYNDEDYIWLKEYLQLEGLCYKLVPIKTPIDESNPLGIGRIDSDLMYKKIMEWEWGNSGSDSIYYDPETRKNSISYRGNMARLLEQLIAENKHDKAEKIADLAIEKMPVDYFGYYDLLQYFITTYYHIKALDKARMLYHDITIKYQEQLRYFSELPIEKQKEGEVFSLIIENIESYRSFVDILISQRDENFALEETKKFNNYLKLFRHFMSEDDYKEEEPEIIEDKETLDSLINLRLKAANTEESKE